MVISVKKSRIILLIVSSILVISLIVFDILYFKTKSKISFKDSITINVGNIVPTISDYTNGKSFGDISWDNIKLDKNNKVYYTGEYTGKFTYNDKTYKVSLKVQDKEQPKIEGVKDLEITVGEEIDFYKDITITDNSKDELKKEIKGEYDLNKTGEYNLTYVVIDKSNNKTTKDFKLTVKEEAKKETKVEEKKQETKNTTSTSSKGYKIETINGITYINGILIANKTYALPSTYNPGGLLTDFTTNFEKMKNDALAQGINLYVVSGFRSYQTQANLYNRYVARDGQAQADRYSARPGHSEHQSGLAADINSVDTSFENTPEGKWLNENCSKYGFIIRYPKGKESITGYIYEAWHIRYVGVDVASKLYNNGNWVTLEEYLGINSSY